MVITSPSLSFIGLLGMGIKFNLNGNSCMEVGIRRVYIHTRNMFVNHETYAAQEYATEIRSGGLFYNTFSLSIMDFIHKKYILRVFDLASCLIYFDRL